ncbi:MAG: T9SS type A sorting domain-containing protein, partial [Crocinitomicaceae bacterium]|nr:T9SS type A sorting domain-containing protein [Crocinitomicaceae bacterium]
DFTTYTLIGANDDDVDGGSAAPRFSICGLTPGNTYYLMHDSQSTFATGQYTLALTEIVVEAGTSNGILNVCTGDTVDLTNGITGQDLGGTWVEAINTANFADPIFPSAGLAYQIFDFEYFVVDGCAVDSIDQQVEIYGPSSAGNDGTLSVCQNEPFNLLSGLSGNVDIGGTWIDPNSLPMTSADTTASSIPGSYNFDYITDNGVCPSDTANVVVIVSPSCDYLNIEDIYFGNMTVYPNPSTGLVFIANYGSTEVFNYTVTDIQGKVVATKDAAINGETVTEINLNKLETGVYFINVFNQNTKGTFRVIIE